MKWLIDFFRIFRKPNTKDPSLATTEPLSPPKSMSAIPSPPDTQPEIDTLKAENEAYKAQTEAYKAENEKLSKDNITLRLTNERLEKQKYETMRLQNEESKQILRDMSGDVCEAVTGTAIHGAVIHIESLETKYEYKTASDDYGDFSLPLPIGLYRVTVLYDGYLPVAGSVHVTEKHGGQVNFARLVKDPTLNIKPG